jgi:hypothetical protein
MPAKLASCLFRQAESWYFAEDNGLRSPDILPGLPL